MNGLSKSLLFLLFVAVIISGCKQGNGSFEDLSGGAVSEVDATTITQFIPDSGSAIIQQGDTQQFFVTAVAPLGRSVTLTWKLNGQVMQEGPSQGFSLSGQVSNIGDHNLEVTAGDGISVDTKSWAVKVNGPPTLSKITTSTPKVSIGQDDDGNDYETFIEVQAIDPNSDSLTYTWKLNGVTSPYLTSVTPISANSGRARLVGNEDIVGSVNISVEVSDGTVSSSESWNAEINYFPMACNQLTQNKICTYAGSPNIGQGLNPDESQVGIRIQPRASTFDEYNNAFISDYVNNVIWYWNRSNASVTRLGVTIPAKQMKVVVGNGDASSGSNGNALEKGLNSPHGLAWISDGSGGGTLWISEYAGNKVKYVDNGGTIRQETGISCSRPAGMSVYNDKLYVACYNSHRVIEWDLINQTASIFAGSSAGFSGDGGAPASARIRNPNDVFANADGVYIADYGNDRIRFIRWGGAGSNKVFWSAGTSVTVAPNTIRTIIGNGSSGDNTNVTPTSKHCPEPTGVVAVNNIIYVTTRHSNRDHVIVANNSGGAFSIGSMSVSDSRAKVATFHTGSNNAGGYNGSGVPIESARVRDPWHIAYSSIDQSLYISDYSNRRFREIRLSDGKLYDRVGSGDARNGNNGPIENPTLLTLLNSPGGVTWDKTSNSLFYSDQNNRIVRRVSQFGLISGVYGDGSNSAPTSDNDLPSNVSAQTTYSGNTYMNGLFALLDGSLLILNGSGHNLRAWNRSKSSTSFASVYMGANRVSTIAGDILDPLSGAGPINVNPIAPATQAALTTQFYYPTGVSAHEIVDGSGNVTSRSIYVVDQGNHCVRKIDDNGNLSTVAGECIYSSNINSDGGFNVNDGNDPTTVKLNRPHDVIADHRGNIYIADTFNNRIRYVNFTASAVSIGGISVGPGQIKTVVCRDGWSGSGDAEDGAVADLARCYRPMGLAYYKGATQEWLCYSQFWRHNVRCLNLIDGKIRTVAGGHTLTAPAGFTFGFEQEGIDGTAARLMNPKGLTFDENGDLYISEQGNHIIRKLKLSPD